MDKMVWLVLVLVAVVDAMKVPPKYPRMPEEVESMEIERVACTDEHGLERNQLMEQARCGPPKDVFVSLVPKSKTLEVTPSAVWVKRCVGTCDFTSQASCIPTETRTRQVSVRVYDEASEKEFCALFPVEEHVACSCCALSAERCAAPRVFSPRKCACACADRAARRRCRAQPHMKWNNLKCQCEARKNGYPRRFKQEPFGMNSRPRRALL